MSDNQQLLQSNRADNWLKWYLQVVGVVTLLAFAAAVMPEGWMIGIARLLGIDPFPREPLTFYLARNLAVLYGFVGVAVLVLASDLDRYRVLVGYLAIGTVLFGVGQLLVNAQSGLPWWWTFGEGGSTVFGGVLMRWLYQRSRYAS